ncbi:hypothetical protein C1H88_11215 [Streptococcus agalactiae]|nr:hypothetical protein C1H88_11215 [Streptococcus agalactiae]
MNLITYLSNLNDSIQYILSSGFLALVFTGIIGILMIFIDSRINLSLGTYLVKKILFFIVLVAIFILLTYLFYKHLTYNPFEDVIFE